ncbi:hypothetical protein F511_06605 [Dorcoceras hygrometricum]|uniref:Uncharacterized protein n=1 Tax=Dorcoceras hygrometricum TaxID=472368 RepID=A0A2Z7B513_9LAMI|nr:hypothetical protein F511_06605 [Dorcoceras hygrometricum]
MASSTDSVIRSITESVDSIPTSPEVKEPMLPNQAELGSSSQPWYEVGRKRNLWRCEMLWRDNVYTFTPSTPERSPNLISFLADMRDKCNNAPELVKEDLLCHFEFSRKGIELIEDLVKCMGKATLLKTMKECHEEGSSGVAGPPVKVMPSALTPPSPTTPMTAKAIPEVPSSEVGPRTETAPGWAPALNIFEVSLVVSTSGSVATGLLCNMIPSRDVARVQSATNAEAVGLFATQFAAVCSCSTRALTLRLYLHSNPLTLTQEMVWGDEVIGCLTRAQREVNDIRQHFDETLEHYTKLEMRLADLEAARAQEERAVEAQREVLEAQGQKLTAERAALVIEKGALAADKEALEAEKRAIRTELDALLVKKTIVEEEFFKSSEFEDLCTKRSLAYFKSGFESCVAQFRANGYSEEEHPDPFLNVARSIEELPEDEEEDDDGADEDASGDEVTPPPSPEH